MFSASAILKYWPIVQVVVVLYCYQLSLAKGEVLPIPYTTITGTLIHYPQCLFFRLAYIVPTGFYIITVYTYYDLIKSHALTAKVQPIPGIVKYSGISAMVCMSLTGCSVENGKYDYLWHLIPAVSFFTLQMINVFFITIKLLQIKLIEPLLVSWASVICKLILSVILLIAVIVCAVGILTADKEAPLTSTLTQDAWINILEWISWVCFVTFYMSQGYDLDNITYVMDLEKKATVEAISQESYADSMISHADDYLSTLYQK